jgi:phospholipid transport system substrate-binding protein
MNRASFALGRRRVFAAAAILIATLGSAGATATAGASAESIVEKLAADIWAVLRRTDLPAVERQAQLIDTIDGYTDVTLLGRLALGRHWRQLDDDQRRTYDRLFKQVVIGSLARRLSQYTSDEQGPLEHRFDVLGSQPAGKSDILVRSRLMLPRGDAVTLDWRLRQRDDDLVVIDLVIEGVSLLVSQRSEFAAVIERSGMDGLLAELQARAEATGS